MVMDRTEAIKSSIKKWHPGIWNEMEEHLKYADMNPDKINNRWHIFRTHMWGSCGFCEWYRMCTICPLHNEYCTGNLPLAHERRNVVGMIVRAWEEKDINRFHEYRRKLVKFMASQLIEEIGVVENGISN